MSALPLDILVQRSGDLPRVEDPIRTKFPGLEVVVVSPTTVRMCALTPVGVTVEQVRRLSQLDGVLEVEDVVALQWAATGCLDECCDVVLLRLCLHRESIGFDGK